MTVRGEGGVKNKKRSDAAFIFIQGKPRARESTMDGKLQAVRVDLCHRKDDGSYPAKSLVMTGWCEKKRVEAQSGRDKKRDKSMLKSMEIFIQRALDGISELLLSPKSFFFFSKCFCYHLVSGESSERVSE